VTDLIERLYESRFHMLEAADEIERLETLLATAEHNEAHACEAMNLMRARLAEAVATMKQLDGCRDGLCGKCRDRLDVFIDASLAPAKEQP